MDDIKAATLMIWSTRFIYALTLGVTFWYVTHSDTLREFVGYGLFLIFWSIVCLSWLKILETLRDEEITKRKGLYDDPFSR